MSAIRKLNEFETTTPRSLAVAPVLTGIVAGVALDAVLGKVLNLNILGAGAKICSFNCAYCSMGATTIRLNQVKKEATLPSVEQVKAEVQHHLAHVIGQGADFDVICVSGNGEPTLHPDFIEITNVLLELRRQIAPLKKLAIRTNASTLDTRKIADAVNLYDERVVKLDAGNERMFKLLNGPLTRKTLSRIITDMRSLTDVIIESTFIQGAIDNTEASHIEDWMEAVAMTRPKRVHIGTIHAKPTLTGVVPCNEDALDVISSRFERKSQIRAIVAATRA